MTPEFLKPWEAEIGLTDDQLRIMEEFRERLSSEGLLEAWLDNRPMLFRFCQARKWQIPEALTMLRNSLAFRKKWGMDEWVETPGGLTPRFLIDVSYPELQGIKAAYNFTYHKCGKSGMPVYFDKLGEMSFKEMMKVR